MDHTESFCEKRQKDSVEYSLGLMQGHLIRRECFAEFSEFSLLSSVSRSSHGSAYNEFVETFAKAHGFHWWEPFGMAPVLVSTGLYSLRSLRPRGRYNGGLQQPT